MNSVVIGLGGTGGEIIKFLKQKIALDNKESFIDYLYVDSDMKLMNTRWTIAGKNISLSPSNQLKLDYLNMSEVFENPQNYSHITSWLGKASQWNHILDNFTQNNTIFGQQKRRLGRYLFASSAKKFNKAVVRMASNLQERSGTDAIEFYICSGLSGGTGSGSLIDAIVQVKKNYPSSKIFLFLFLPEEVAHVNGQNKDTGNYHANAYAALKELNDLEIGAWKPHDVTADDNSRTTDSDFIQKIYLVTDKNANGVKLSMKKSEPERLLADFLHQKISGLNQAIIKVEQAENIQAGCEMENGKNVRSRNFMTFGIKRISFPKEEIENYMTYKSSYSLLLCMLYNNWNDSNGYLAQENPLNIEQVVNAEFKNSTGLSDAVLILEEGVLSNESYKNYDLEWRGILQKENHKFDLAKYGNDEKFEEITKKLEHVYEETYRGKGVKRFFEQETAATESRAKSISTKLEKHLFERWLYTRAYSIGQIIEIVNTLFDKLTAQKVDFAQEKTKEESKLQLLLENIENAEAKYTGAGLTKIFGMNKKYHEYAKALQAYYIASTKVKAYTYAEEELLPALLTKITALTTKIKQTNRELTELMQEMKSEYEVQLKEEENVSRVLDKTIIDTSLDTYVLKSRRNHAELFAMITNKIKETMGKGTFAFDDLNKYFDQNAMRSFLDSVIRRASIDMVHQTENINITNKNIIDELYAQYGNNDDALTDFIRKAVRESSEFLPFDSAQDVQNQADPLNENAEILILVMPMSTDANINEGFRNTLVDLFSNSTTAEQGMLHAVDMAKQDGEDIATVNENEILLIKAKSTFPLRKVKRVKFLQDKYNSALENNPKISLEIHTEDREYNALYSANLQDYVDKGIIHLIILLGGDKLKLVDNNYTLYINDEHGVQIHNPIKMGNDITKFHTKSLSPNEWMLIETEVEKYFNELRYLGDEKKNECIAKLIEENKKVASGYKLENSITEWGLKFSEAIDRIKKVQ